MTALPRLAGLLLATFAAFALAACGEKSEPDPDTLPELIIYTKGGGVAGGTQIVKIFPGNEVRVSLEGEDPRPIDVPPALVADARAAVEAVDFGAEIPSTPPGPDEFTLDLVYGAESIGGSDSVLADVPGVREAQSAFAAIIGTATASAPEPASDSGSGPG